MFKKLSIFTMMLFSFSFGGQLSNTTGVMMTDWDGNTYDLDALLSSGRHVFIHQMYSG